MSKRILWTNNPNELNYEDWEDELNSEYPELSEEEKEETMYEINDMYIDDVRINLNISLQYNIIVIASLGLWDGTRLAYKELNSNNVADCFYGEYDYLTWYIEDGELCCEGVHHDGTNYLTYRTYREDLSEKEIGKFRRRLLNGEVTVEEIKKHTRSLQPEVATVYC